jgi:hypothetical protein
VYTPLPLLRSGSKRCARSQEWKKHGKLLSGL